jgi:hypothetical protein
MCTDRNRIAIAHHAQHCAPRSAITHASLAGGGSVWLEFARPPAARCMAFAAFFPWYKKLFAKVFRVLAAFSGRWEAKRMQCRARKAFRSAYGTLRAGNVFTCEPTLAKQYAKDGDAEILSAAVGADRVPALRTTPRIKVGKELETENPPPSPNPTTAGSKADGLTTMPCASPPGPRSRTTTSILCVAERRPLLSTRAFAWRRGPTCCTRAMPVGGPTTLQKRLHSWAPRRCGRARRGHAISTISIGFAGRT